MRVCFLNRNLNPGGAERTVAYLANFLIEQGVNVDIVLYGERGFYELDERINIHYISTSIESHSFFKTIKAHYNRFINFYKYKKEYKPNIVFSILYPPTIYALPFLRKIVFVISERSNPAYLKSKIKIFIRRYLLKRADGIIFQTLRAKEYYKKIVKEKGAVIPNAIGNEDVYKVPEVIKRENKISAMGRITSEKDYPTLLKAFSIISQKHPELTLEIYGAGSPDTLINLTEKLKIKDKVFFMGAHSDAILKIANAKCYVLSSISEGMPNALMEAMAVGLPCVSTDCPNGPAELIENGVNGLLVPISDEKALSEAIMRMIEDTDFAESCGQNALKIKESHSIKINAQKYLDYFNMLIKTIKGEKS